MFRNSLLMMLILGSASIATAQNDAELHTRGWLEHARLMPCGMLMDAKLDSGAGTTSLHAEILPPERAANAAPDTSIASLLQETESAARLFLTGSASKDTPDDPPPAEVTPIADTSMEQKAPDMVTFRLTSGEGREVILTEPVTRWVSIRRRGGGSIIRPVVLMDLCVGGQRVRGEVNLADRTGFNYPLLIGRNMLSEAAITVDSRQIYTAASACPETS